MRIFSPAGEIIYSSEPAEVGHFNEEAYFRELAASGAARAEIIPKPVQVSRERGRFRRRRRDLRADHQSRAATGGLRAVPRRLPGAEGPESAHLSLLRHAVRHDPRPSRPRPRQLPAGSPEHAGEGAGRGALRQISLTDDLTGLYNRRGFLALAEQQTRVANRDRKPMMVISVDVDRLKGINDTFGHTGTGHPNRAYPQRELSTLPSSPDGRTSSRSSYGRRQSPAKPRPSPPGDRAEAQPEERSAVRGFSQCRLSRSTPPTATSKLSIADTTMYYQPRRRRPVALSAGRRLGRPSACGGRPPLATISGRQSRFRSGCSAPS